MVNESDIVRNVQFSERDQFDNKNSFFIGICKLFKGSIETKNPIYFISEDRNIIQIQNFELFLIMGSSLYPVRRISEGNIFAIRIQSEIIDLKTFSTFSSDKNAPFFTYYRNKVFPVLKVAITAEDSNEQNEMIKSVSNLCITDQSASYFVDEFNQCFLFVCGDIHLERCKTDLEDLFAKDLKFKVSKPIVQFKETILLNNNINNRVEKKAAENSIKFTVSSYPIIGPILSLLEDEDNSLDLISKTSQENYNKSLWPFKSIKKFHIDKSKTNILITDFSLKLGKNEKTQITKNSNSNLENFSEEIPSKKSVDKEFSPNQLTENGKSFICESLRKMAKNSFEKVCENGPICKEPLIWICFNIERVEIFSEEEKIIDRLKNENSSKQIYSVLIKSLVESLELNQLRLVQPFYNVILNTPLSALKNTSQLISQFGGRILSDTVKGTNLFVIDCIIPVYTYNEFIQELRNKSSGKVVAQVKFSRRTMHLIDQDPFLHLPESETTQTENPDEKTNHYVLKIVNELRAEKGMALIEPPSSDSDLE